MGIAKMRYYPGLDGLKIDTKLMAAALAALPDKTKFVGVGTKDLYLYLLFENRIFRDGAEINSTYHRDIAIIGEKVIEVDHFRGLNLKECLIDENDKNK